MHRSGRGFQPDESPSATGLQSLRAVSRMTRAGWTRANEAIFAMIRPDRTSDDAYRFIAGSAEFQPWLGLLEKTQSDSGSPVEGDAIGFSSRPAAGGVK